MFECMFDEVTSKILAELEYGGKELSYLAKMSGISEDQVRKQLSYLMDYEFIKEHTTNGKTIFSADAEKLSEIIEKDENFDTAVDGLTKMDSYLN